MSITTSQCAAGLAPISLVLTVHDDAEYLPALLNSIGRQQLLPSELLITDLGSTDGTLQILRDWLPPQGTSFTLIEAKGASVSFGRNLAIEAAGCDYIAVTHGAVRLHTEWLSRLWTALVSVGGVVTGVIKPTGTSLLERTIAEIEAAEFDAVKPSDHLPPSTSLGFAKELWDAVGGYPEWLDAGQDRVFALLLRQAGASITVVPEAVTSWSPHLSIPGYLRASFQDARADGQAGIVERAQTRRRIAGIGGLVALLMAPRSPLAQVLAAAGLAYRLGGIGRHRTSDQPTERPWRRAGLAAGVVLMSDVAKLAGHCVGVARRLQDKDGVERSVIS